MLAVNTPCAIPVTETSKIVALTGVTVAVPDDRVTSVPVKPLTGSLKTAVKWIGETFVGSAWALEEAHPLVQAGQLARTTIDLTDFPKDALTLELESFAAAVIDNTPPLVDGEAGLRALKVALDIMQHIKKQPRTHI